MKALTLLIITIIIFLTSYAQNNKSACQVEVSKVSVLTTFGYLNYTVEFHNKSNKTVDGIYWTARFYDNSGELIKKEESSFNSGGLIDPVASGFKKSLARLPKVKGASKVFITIDKVHFSTSGNCP